MKKLSRFLVGTVIISSLFIYAPFIQAKTVVKAISAPKGATAQCRDKTYSFSQHRNGTCSHHKGVLKWLK